MSPQEAAAQFNLNIEEELPEQFELILFELKQKIYRQLDQLLLYPKWFNEIQRIHRAAQALHIAWPDAIQIQDRNLATQQLILDLHLPMLAFFNQYQSYRKEMALQFHRADAPLVLQNILKEWSEIQKQYMGFWSNTQVSSIEVQLTAQFDPQAILLIIQQLKDTGVLLVTDLNQCEIPELLQRYIAWNQKIWSKLQLN